jgi:hypothetical protein
MSDVSVTAVEVLPGSDTVYAEGVLGATVTAGQTVYLDTSTTSYKLADSNLSAAAAVTAGVAMNGGVTGQVVRVAISGLIDPGFTVLPGMIYIQSGTAGGIAPCADIANGVYTTVLGLGITASSLRINLVRSGVVAAVT